LALLKIDWLSYDGRYKHIKIKLMDQIIIKKAGIEDASALQQIGKETFFETFAASNTDEDMQKYLEENFNLDKISAEINNPFSEFYIAYSEIGYLKLNSGDAQTELMMIVPLKSNASMLKVPITVKK
jgi:hypothetical protein